MSQLTSTIELFDGSRDHSMDADNASMSRMFLVPADRDSAVSQPGVPAIGSIYTINGIEMKVDRHDVKGTGDPEISIVTALYSANGLYKFPQQQDEQSPTYKSTNFAIQRRKITIPSFVAQPFYFEVGGFPVGKLRWVRQDFDNIEIYEIVLQVRVTLQSFTQSSWVAIANQMNAIHSFGGKEWKFSGADVDQTSQNLWEVTYEWIHDPGTPALPTIDDTVTPPARLPFYEYVAVPSDSEGQAPSFTTQRFVTEIPNGHESLPGGPI